MKLPTQVWEEPNHPVLSITAMTVYKQQSLVRSSDKSSGIPPPPHSPPLNSSLFPPHLTIMGGGVLLVLTGLSLLRGQQDKFVYHYLAGLNGQANSWNLYLARLQHSIHCDEINPRIPCDDLSGRKKMHQYTHSSVLKSMK